MVLVRVLVDVDDLVDKDDWVVVVFWGRWLSVTASTGIRDAG